MPRKRERRHCVYVSTEQYDELKKHAMKRGQPVAWLMRWAVRDYLRTLNAPEMTEMPEMTDG